MIVPLPARGTTGTKLYTRELAERAQRGHPLDVQSRWEHVLGAERSLALRLASTLSIGGCGFTLTFVTYRATGFYLTSIVIVTVILVALVGGTRLAVLHALAISLAADYFFIPPVGMVLTSPASWEHLGIIVSTAIAVAVAASSMRVAFRETLESRRKAEESSRVMERMLALVSHDVRNPLATVRLAVRMSDGATESRQRELRAMMVRNLDHADAMIQSLLDVASIRAGKALPLAFGSCDLAEEVRAIVAETRVAGRGRVEVVAAESIVGSWSVAGIRRALDNLITNAVKYGAPNAPIVVRLERRDAHALLSVHNDGAPIPWRYRARLFEPFERAGASEEVTGWGLGLSLVRAIAEAHGGTISLESAAPAGTTFTLDLPIAAAS